LLPRGVEAMSRAHRLVSEWAIRRLDRARVELWTPPENETSQRVAERVGFAARMSSARYAQEPRWGEVVGQLSEKKTRKQRVPCSVCSDTASRQLPQRMGR
jgi:RimJ/RimL family protein N-acetyltransferase